MNTKFDKKIILTLIVIFVFPLVLFSEDRYEYSKQEFSRDLHRMEYSPQEWKEIACVLMHLSFENPEQDTAYIKELPVYQNILILSFLRRWKNNLYCKSDYIKLLLGSSRNEPSAIKKLLREKLLEYVSKGTVSAEFLSDICLYAAVHRNNFTQQELDDLIMFFPKIKSNMAKEGLFMVLVMNDFFKRKELPPQYSNYLNSLLYERTNVLRQRMKLPLLPAKDSSTPSSQDQSK